MKVLSVYRTELKEGDKAGCRKMEALDQRAGPVLKQCTEKGMSRKTGRAKGRNGGGWRVWFDVVRKSRVVMLAGCEAD
jgi:hypothetical protein